MTKKSEILTKELNELSAELNDESFPKKIRLTESHLETLALGFEYLNDERTKVCQQLKVIEKSNPKKANEIKEEFQKFFYEFNHRKEQIAKHVSTFFIYAQKRTCKETKVIFRNKAAELLEKNNAVIEQYNQMFNTQQKFNFN